MFQTNKWNVPNFAVKPLACSSWLHLSFKHFDIISTVDKSTDHGKLLSINLLNMTSLAIDIKSLS